MTTRVVFWPAAAACLATALLCGASEAPAQGWVVDASAGQIVHDPLPGSVATLGATLGIRHDGPRWGYLSGGIPFDSTGPSWGALGLGSRLASSGAVGVGADLAGHAYGFRDPVARGSGGGATLEAMPLLFAGAGPARLELRSGLLHHTALFSGETLSRSVHQSDARLSVGSPTFQVTGEGRYVRAAEGTYPYAGAVAEAVLGQGALWGYAGKWLSEAIEIPVWGAGARVGVAGLVEVYASVQQETNDPLFRNAPRRSWSVGVSRRLGPAPRPAHVTEAPAALSGAVVGAGRVTFRVPVSASPEPPAVGGEFNRWEAVPMVREGDSWSVTLPVGPGIYRYAFRKADGEWFVPETVPGRTDDGFGGMVATVIVP